MRYEIKKKRTVPEKTEPRPMPERAVGHVTAVPHDQSVCAGCGTCELMCALVHEGDAGPMHQRIWVERHEFQGFPVVQACHQCDAPECYFACPTGALSIDPRTHARYINEEVCVGCLSCYEACAYTPHRINYDSIRIKALKCDLCTNRAEGPACVEFCPQKALVLNLKEAYDER
ncbi:MAG: 4Fe-4S dicluster domain-containing protein [bacterium]|nr:4Fe-4S dicluster domain-containing protein [bacterium]